MAKKNKEPKSVNAIGSEQQEDKKGKLNLKLMLKAKPRLKINTQDLSWSRMKWANPRRSVGAKLFLFIFVSILACVLVVGTLAYNKSKSIIRENAADSNYQTIQQAAGKLKLLFDNYETLTLQVMVDTAIQEQLSIIRDDSLAQFDRFQATTKVNSLLQKYILSNSSIANGYLIPLQAGAYSLGSSAFDQELAEKSDWYQTVKESQGQSYWIETKVEGVAGTSAEPTLGVSRLLKSSVTSEPIFVLVFEIKLSAIQDALGEISLGDGSIVSIVDTKNRYVMYPGDDANAKAKLGTEADVALPAFVVDGDNGGSLEVNDTEGTSVIAAYSEVNSAGWRIVGKTPINELVSDANAIFVLTFIVTAAAAVAAIVICYFMIRMFANPLVQLRNLMNEGERGNLSVRLHLNRKDEIGQLTDSFNRMMTEITSLVDQTSGTADEVLATASVLTEASRKTAVSAKEIAVATEEIAGGATSLAIEAERGSDLTTTISTQMQNLLSNNQSMEASATTVQQASEQGTSYMNVLIEKTGLTEQMTRSMVEKVDRLKDSTSSIRKILDVLNNLTKQTNILSLNATIEAARAGVAGKGFMVVADEIRKLADQSRHSIDVVAQITDTIQREIDETVEVLTEAHPIFQEQVSSVKETNQIFMAVQSHMSQFSDSLGSVTEAIGKLDESQSVLSDAMTSVSAVAEQSSATSQEVASLSNEQLSVSEELVKLSNRLEDASNKLQQSLSRFTTKSEA
ncbi:methyl-accepting chemotaxis protein [Paenibacillus cellulosilyticus]|uniref:Methyl-accepting chemotaxis protein n=1 Tax=Paenibacillus cellulosilyticus TaxID=375489 RepID=A0A2V2YA92_9BACL|nr:methyl-accepting chemotaxis protein [Paenibacillus cellulosilyticus]PWV88402.1 methyl-accepting chemotaxis protein [Paenibacillus cellulosilyticus]